MSATDARLWHHWLRINRVLGAMLHTPWSAEAWAQIRVEFKKALALRSQIRRTGCTIATGGLGTNLLRKDLDATLKPKDGT